MIILDNMKKKKSEETVKSYSLRHGNKPHRLTKEDRSKGGQQRTKKRKVMWFMKKKCKTCHLPCPIKDQGIKENSKCKIPDVKRKILEAAFEPEKLMESIFADLMELQTIANGFEQKRDVYNAKLSLEKHVNPTDRNLNVKQITVGITFEDLKKMYDETV